MHSEVVREGFVFSKNTQEVEVSVQPFYLEDQSSPADCHFIFAYRVLIVNRRTEAVKLLARRWEITDGTGHTHVVEGSGVIGEQPRLKPGGTFEYSSYTALATPTGIMSGIYKMTNDDGGSLQVQIPAFSLDAPDQIMLPN